MELRACCVELLTEREHVLRHMHVTSLGFCLSVNVSEKSLNLEKTISSVLSVIVK